MSLSVFFYHPAVYAGLLPLAITLVVCALPRWKVETKAAIGILAGFLVSAWMAIGTGLLTLDSTAKLVWAAVPAFAIGWVFVDRPQWLRPLLALIAVGLPLWLIAPLITRDGIDALIRYWYLPLFNLYLLYSVERVVGSRRASLAALLVLALGVGISAIVGASILYGERAVSLAAGVGALVIRHLLRSESGAGRGLVMPVTLMVGTLAGISTVYASVPASALVFMAAVPWVAQLPILRGSGPVLAFTLTLGYCLLPVLLAIATVWYVVGSIVF